MLNFNMIPYEEFKKLDYEAQFKITLDFATKAHEGQVRKATGIPMITHPQSVSNILKLNSDNQALVLSGLLHDTVEDTSVTMDDIEFMFGKEVADIVASNTEDKSKTWEERKEHTINKIKHDGLTEHLLLCADKFDNLYQLNYDILITPDHQKVWSVFKRGAEQQKWYFTSIANEFNKVYGNNPPSLIREYILLTKNVNWGVYTLREGI